MSLATIPDAVYRTDEKMSTVFPIECLANSVFKAVENDWNIKVEGVIDFSLTGLLTSLAGSLS